MSATIGMFVSRTISFSAAFASEVSVFVIVWTEIGASPPTATDPTWICRLFLRVMSRQGLMLIVSHGGSHTGTFKRQMGPRLSNVKSAATPRRQADAGLK